MRQLPSVRTVRVHHEDLIVPVLIDVGYATIDPSSVKSNPEAPSGAVNGSSSPEPTSTIESVCPAPVGVERRAPGRRFAVVLPAR